MRGPPGTCWKRTYTTTSWAPTAWHCCLLSRVLLLFMRSTLERHASLKYLKVFTFYCLGYALCLARSDHYFEGLCLWDNR